jgi:DNA-binding transcriptional ArsR family regulator
VNGFYITVANGLLSEDHRERIGIALWEFLWCLDKITKIDDKGTGWVLGGKPINLAEVGLGMSEDTVSRNLHKLEEEGYIKLIRTPYGISIRVSKAKKRFRNNAVSITSGKSAVSLRKSAVSNKTYTEDSNRIDTAEKIGGDEINLFIGLFEIINPTFTSLFPRKDHRNASKRLLKLKTHSEWERVIKFIASRRNDKYCPRISTPSQLEMKYADLETYAAGLKQSLQNKKSEIAFK